MNFTKHGMFRYLQRVKQDERFLTEERLNLFSKKNLEEYELLKSQIEKEVSKENLFYLGTFKIREHDTCDYFLDKENKILFLSKSGNVVTCLKLNYLDNEEADKLIFEGFIKALEEIKAEVEKLEIEEKEETFSCEVEIKEIELAIKKHNIEILNLEENKNFVQRKLNGIKEQLELKKEQFKITVEKMMKI